MFYSICWIAGFAGVAFLLLSLLFSTRRYFSVFGFEETSSRLSRNMFYALFSLLILVSVFSNRFFDKEDAYNTLSIVSGIIGLISFGLGFWVLSNVHIGNYRDLIKRIRKKEQNNTEKSDRNNK